MAAGYYWHLVCESRSVVSDSLHPRGLYSPWNSLGQNTRVGSLSLLQWIFLTQDLPDSADLLTQESTRGLLHCRRILQKARIMQCSGQPCMTKNSPRPCKLLNVLLHIYIGKNLLIIISA